jgi:ribonuclease VapC
MVIDTSALLALFFEEPEAHSFASAIAEDFVRLISAATVFEASIVMEARRGEPGVNDLDLLLHKIAATIVPFVDSDVATARDAFRIFGKGRHPAGLNFGDCFSYALAKATGEPLLFKGSDFAKTDIVPVTFDT